MKQILMRRGTILVEEVPAPLICEGHVLVEVSWSLVSSGTESKEVEQSSKSLAMKAIEHPGKIKRLVKYFEEHGVKKTIQRVRSHYDRAGHLGYSCAGIALSSGGVTNGITTGDRVACAGTGHANHAEIVLVPRNLVVPVPDECTLKDASSIALGSIALQGVRRASTCVGDVVAVIGLGLLGQITAQILSASGCRVMGIDPDGRRGGIARSLGTEPVFESYADAVHAARNMTGGHGLDATIITAATRSHEVLQQAMDLTRKKGKVIIVGDVGMNVSRSPFYEKEIDLLISCSYGPGRYDSSYEGDGHDYPYSHVRWTENRNMSEYLRLVSQGAIDLTPVLEAEVDLDDAARAYDALQSTSDRPLGVVLRYPAGEMLRESKMRTSLLTRKPRQPDGRIGLAVVGAGGFAGDIHLPNLLAHPDLFSLRTAVCRTGASAKAAAEQYGFERASTNPIDAWEDDNVDAVLISTRHDQHARLALSALGAGKHVFVEKPLAITAAEIEAIIEFYVSPDPDPDQPILMTGFNRRFSPHAHNVKDLIDHEPFICGYRMNAGYIPLDHWLHGPEGGGRNLGEACHIYDLFTYWSDSRIETIDVTALNPKSTIYSKSDNFIATLRFDCGSIASLLYTSMGTESHPKEQSEIFCAERVISLDDYRSVKIPGSHHKGIETRRREKGHREELERFGRAIQERAGWPIPLWQQVQATRIALTVEDLL